MASKRTFYWIKIRDTFLTSDNVDFLMSQKNGANYIVLYQMLCLKTINNNGVLGRELGEFLVPYDAEKISRDCKWFDIDTVVVALELYKKLGLIYKQEDGFFRIANFEDMVGSETNWAIQKRDSREKTIGGHLGGQCLLEKDKDIEIDKEKDILDISKEKETPKRKAFVKPTIEEITQYCKERNNNIDPQKFLDFYESKGWMIGKNHMKDWKASVRTWERENKTKTINVVKQVKSVPSWYKDYEQELNNTTPKENNLFIDDLDVDKVKELFGDGEGN